MDSQITARDTVSSIPELLESILLQVDAFNLLTSLSVSHHWRTLILQSTLLRQHLSDLQPPAYLPNHHGTTGSCKGIYRIIDSDATHPWCFRTPALHGTLWVLRIPQNPKKALVHLRHSEYRKRLLGVRRVWRHTHSSTLRRRRVLPSHHNDWPATRQHIEGPLIPDLEFRYLSTGKVVCRTETKQTKRRQNTLREYLVLFYGAEFERMTGEKLTFGTPGRWEEYL